MGWCSEWDESDGDCDWMEDALAGGACVDDEGDLLACLADDLEAGLVGWSQVDDVVREQFACEGW